MGCLNEKLIDVMMRMQMEWKHGRLYISLVAILSTRVQHLGRHFPSPSCRDLHVCRTDHHTSAQQNVVELLKEW